MTYTKKMAATQVSAVTNSYMLPHGARCTANPRVTTATRCARMPTALSVTAARTQGPACQMARHAGACRDGSEGSTGTSPADGVATSEADEADDGADPAPATPTAASSAVRSPAATVPAAPRTAAAAAARRGRPKAKSPAKPSTASE